MTLHKPCPECLSHLKKSPCGTWYCPGCWALCPHCGGTRTAEAYDRAVKAARRAASELLGAIGKVVAL